MLFNQGSSLLSKYVAMDKVLSLSIHWACRVQHLVKPIHFFVVSLYGVVIEYALVCAIVNVEAMSHEYLSDEYGTLLNWTHSYLWYFCL